MKILTTIIAILGLIITIVFTIAPIGNLIIFPALITILSGLLLFKNYKKENKSTKIPKIIIGIAILGALISFGRTLFTTDNVAVDENFEKRQENSSNQAIKDLEGLE
jgi:membrane-bound ClpP family serine protease|tara:strand:- start:312 stop:632 length:321 start_codon:yes stop_codon:yes gene_type:complete